MGLPPPGQVLYPRDPTRPSTAVISRIDPRAAAVSALAQYLRDAEFVKWGAKAPDIKFQLTAVHEEWADPSKTLDYPVAGIIDASPTAMEPSRLTPKPLEETLDLFGKGTVLWKLAEVSQLMQVDFYTGGRPDREAIAAALPGLFAPGEDTSRVVLTGHPKHYGTPVRCSLENYRRMDTDGQVYESERRLMARIWCDVDVVELRCARPLILQARVEVEYPETFALQTVQIEASPVLLDYANATFGRDSPASFVDPRAGGTFQASTEPENWLAENIPRIFSDGAILIEDERKNLVPFSEDYPSWNIILGTDVLTGGQLAPDLGLDAFIVRDDDSANFEGLITTLGPLPSAGRYTFSHLVKKDIDQTRFPEFQHNQFSPGGRAHIQINTATGTAVIRTSAVWTDVSFKVIDLVAEWRIALSFTTVSTIPIVVSIIPAASTTLGVGRDASVTGEITPWGSTLELGGFASSSIRSFGVPVTRGAEFASFLSAQVPAAFRSGAWGNTVSPAWDSTASPTSPAYIYSFDADNYLGLVSGTTLRLRASGVNHDLSLGPFSEATAIDIDIDFLGGQMSVDGVGSVALTDDWSADSSSLSIGSDGTTGHLFGVITRPIAARG